jgi:AcrR family transcriptional regulator
MKDKIRNTAAHLFAEHGYKATSMQQIADEVGVTKAALYYHYVSKDKLFLDIITDTSSELITLHHKFSESNLPVWEILEQWVEMMFQYSKIKKDHWLIINKFLSDNIKDRVFEVFMHFWKESYNSMNQIITKGMKEGQIRSDMDSRLITSSIFGIIHGQFTTSWWNKFEIDDNLIKKSILGILQGGIASDVYKKNV